MFTPLEVFMIFMLVGFALLVVVALYLKYGTITVDEVISDYKGMWVKGTFYNRKMVYFNGPTSNCEWVTHPEGYPASISVSLHLYGVVRELDRKAAMKNGLPKSPFEEEDVK